MNHKNFRDISGERFERWTVLSRGPNDENKKTRYFCRCDCGNEVLVDAVNLKRGLTKGCLKCSRTYRDQYHGMSKSKTYAIWIQMIERCHNPNHKYYKWYGSRGIHVCERWQEKFTNFLEDMGEMPEGLSIDRIDNYKGYSKDNCRWATRNEQQQNRRNSIHIGDISNGWKIIRRAEQKKTYLIQCMLCGFERLIKSCNFRRKHQCDCQKEHYE